MTPGIINFQFSLETTSLALLQPFYILLVLTQKEHAPRPGSLQDLARSFRAFNGALLQPYSTPCQVSLNSITPRTTRSRLRIVKDTGHFVVPRYCISRDPHRITRHLIRHFGSKFLFERTMNLKCIMTLNDINLTFIEPLLRVFCTKFKYPHTNFPANRVFLQLQVSTLYGLLRIQAPYGTV